MTATDVHTLDQLASYITQLEQAHEVDYPTEAVAEELA